MQRGEAVLKLQTCKVTTAVSSTKEKHTAVGEHTMRRFDLLKKMAPELRLEEWVEGQEGKRDGKAFQREKIACAQPRAGREHGKCEACKEGYSIRSSGSKVSVSPTPGERGGWKRRPAQSRKALEDMSPEPGNSGKPWNEAESGKRVTGQTNVWGRSHGEEKALGEGKRESMQNNTGMLLL